MKLRSIRALILAFICAFSIPSFAAGIDINTASAEQISQTLKGVGPTKADAIVAYRAQYGAFTSADQLSEVKGIGSATVEKNRELILIVGPKEQSLVTKQ